jgi:hypothetical protein
MTAPTVTADDILTAAALDKIEKIADSTDDHAAANAIDDLLNHVEALTDRILGPTVVGRSNARRYVEQLERLAIVYERRAAAADPGDRRADRDRGTLAALRWAAPLLRGLVDLDLSRPPQDPEA